MPRSVSFVQWTVLLVLVLWAPTARSDNDSDAHLSSMQTAAEKQLVEAAKRKFIALKHHVAAIKLAEAADEDKVKAKLLTRKAALARQDDQLDHAKKAVADAKSRMENLRKRRQDLGKHADEEVANSDKATENVMELEDKAGTIGEKAEEEANKISVVKEAVVKEMKSVPELLTSAAAEEDEAAQLKRRAHEKLYDSRRKTDEADRLDRVAAEKEREAHMIRSRLVAILEEKTRLLDSKVRDAQSENVLSKKGAAEAAKEAKELAARAAARAKLAEKAEQTAEQDMAAERQAQAMVQSEGVEVEHSIVNLANAKQAYEQARRGGKTLPRESIAEDAKVGRLRRQEVQMHRRVMEARREANLLKSARETERVRGRPPLAFRVGRKVVEGALRAEGAATRTEGSDGRGRVASEAEKDYAYGGRDERPGPEVEGSRRGPDGSREGRVWGNVGEDGAGNQVGENSAGHLVVRSRAEGGPLARGVEEDGHWSEREESFKKALAAAYRDGYEHEQDPNGGADNSGWHRRGTEEERDGYDGGERDRRYGRDFRGPREKVEDGEGWHGRRGRDEQREESRGEGRSYEDRKGNRHSRQNEDDGDLRGGQGTERDARFEAALKRNTGQEPYTRMHDALNVSSTQRKQQVRILP